MTRGRIAAAAFSWFLAAGASAGAGSIAPEEARAIAKDATIYGFPLVDGYRVLHAKFVDAPGPGFKAPWNSIHAAGTPDGDVLVTEVGIDLRTEPVVLTVPAVEQRRYYAVQLVDLYTHNFAYLGSRATGNGAGSYLLAGPAWTGGKPAGVTAVIRSETALAMLVFRTQVLGAKDLESARTVQAGYTVKPLSAFAGKPAPASAPPVAFVAPLSPDEERGSPAFFGVLSFVLGFCPTHPTERALRTRFAKLGIGGGHAFDAAALPPATAKALQDGMADAWRALADVKKRADLGRIGAGDLHGTREHLKNIYLFRMLAAATDLYGNSDVESTDRVYHTDSSGKPLDGSRRYALHFAPGRLPPVNAFWSLRTERGVLSSSMLPAIEKDADGGWTIIIPDRLPAPRGPFSVTLRLYWPKPNALDGTWTPPALEERAP